MINVTVNRGAVGATVGTGEQRRVAQGQKPRGARSAALLVRQIRPSSMKRTNRFHRLSL